MKRIILLVLLNSFSCTEKREGYTIKGTISEFANGTILFLSKANANFDSTIVFNNHFIFKGKVKGDFEKISIHTEDNKEYKSMWIVNEEMTFDASSTSFSKAEIKGSWLQDQDNEHESIIAPVKIQMDSVRYLIWTSTNEGEKNISKEQYKLLSIQKKKLEVDFIKTHPEFELSGLYLHSLNNTIDEIMIKELYIGLYPNVKKTKWGKNIALRIKRFDNLTIGNKAFDFALSTIDGRQVSLSDFKGKHVLLKFWSSNCGPCRAENPYLLKAYKEFNDDGFEILGVSLDKNTALWESTIKKDSITWTTVGDLKGIYGEVPTTYGVNYTPKNYLLDKNGIVIAKDLRGSALQYKLEKIFTR